MEGAAKETKVTKTLETHIEIEAPKEKVWGLLTDFPAYPQWNPLHQEHQR
jgi:uncharacterized protein YndB with AHSA1/START domain